MGLTLNLAGAGHVGRALGRLFADAGVVTVQDVLTRSSASAAAACAYIGSGQPCTELTAMRPADIWLLAVNDDQIGPVAAALAASQPLAGSTVLHCSGALASSALGAVREAGAQVASVHPIRSFADVEAVVRGFTGTYCGIEGDAGAIAVLGPAFERIGAQLVPIDGGAKTVYHAAAVFASNYLVTVLDAALRAYQAAGVPEHVARQLAAPLARESMDNVFRMGAAAALSGPVARGDIATVARQQQALAAWDGPTGALYQALVPPTTQLAARKRQLI